MRSREDGRGSLARGTRAEALRARVREFARDYNKHWLLERHDYRTPAEARERLLALAQATVA